MKKYLLCTLLVLPLVFSSCSDDDEKEDKETTLKIYETIIANFDNHYYTPVEHYDYTVRLDTPLKDYPYPLYSNVFVDDTVQYLQTTNDSYNNYKFNFTDRGIESIKITSKTPLTGEKIKIRFFHSSDYIAEW